jgi:hypothetical protein
MRTADANGGKAGVDVTIDAANLPCALTKVKQNVAPSGEFNEEIILEIQRNSREKLRISRVTANWVASLFRCVFGTPKLMASSIPRGAG